jgi:hypothetical protein
MLVCTAQAIADMSMTKYGETLARLMRSGIGKLNEMN